MEAVLDIYQRPEDTATPIVCVDETSKQHIKDTRAPLPGIIGKPRRFDSQYARNGVSNLFMIFAPLQGFRHVEVTDRRTSVDFAHICRDLVDVHFRDAEKILLVCDNLNTHKPASLYKAFPAHQARRIAEKLQFHYTPKHGNRWLNIAERLSFPCSAGNAFQDASLTKRPSSARFRRGKTEEISKAPRSTGGLQPKTHASNSKNCIRQIACDTALVSVPVSAFAIQERISGRTSPFRRN